MAEIEIKSVSVDITTDEPQGINVSIDVGQVNYYKPVASGDDAIGWEASDPRMPAVDPIPIPNVEAARESAEAAQAAAEAASAAAENVEGAVEAANNAAANANEKATLADNAATAANTAAARTEAAVENANAAAARTEAAIENANAAASDANVAAGKVDAAIDEFAADIDAINEKTPFIVNDYNELCMEVDA